MQVEGKRERTVTLPYTFCYFVEMSHYVMTHIEHKMSIELL